MWGIANSPWLNTLVITIGVVIALISIISAHRIAKRRETSQSLFASRSNDVLQDGIKRIVKLHAEGQNLTTFAAKRETEDCKLILYVLNHWEYVAVSIRYRIFDDEMYKTACYTTATSLHEKTRDFIGALRKHHGGNTLFQEFQTLAERWEKKPLACSLRNKK